MFYYRNEEFDKAAPLFKELYRKNPNQSNYNFYFYCLIRMGDYEEAERFVKEQIRTKKNERYEVDLGYVYLLSDRTSRAEKQFETLINDLNPDRTSIINLASAFISRQQYEYAAKTYLRGRSLMRGTYSFQQ